MILSSLTKTIKWEGLALVEGFAKGNALVLDSFSTYQIEKTDHPSLEQKKFHKAIKKLENEFSKALRGQISEEQKSFLDISKMLLTDRGWNKKIEEKILRGYTAQTAIMLATKEIEDQMSKINDLYLRERMNDFRDLANRLMHILNETNSDKKFKKKVNSLIIVGETLGAAQLMDYDLSKIKGIVLSEGSPTMHVAIVARAYNIPLIAGIKEIQKQICSGDFIALDAKKGIVYKNPSDEIMNRLNLAEEKEKKQVIQELKNKNKPTFTKDGHKIELGINLGLADDLLLANIPPFDKVGLYRTELLFMLAKKLPNCDEQTALYRKVIANAKGHPVIFRTLDIGSDKVLPYMQHKKEENPAMGWRSSRITLDHRALLRTQLRALIRALEGNDLYVMFPMIAEVNEFLMAKQALKVELDLAKKDHETLPKNVYVGTMLEIPSLFFYLKNNIQVFDFISIGTNDLKQFFFASDRGNRVVSQRYDNLSPSFLNYLNEILCTCQKAGVPCSVCGEMAGNPLEALVLIGLGFKSLSMNPHSLLKVKSVLRQLNQLEFNEYLMRLIRTETDSIRVPVLAYLRDHHILEE